MHHNFTSHKPYLQIYIYTIPHTTPEHRQSSCSCPLKMMATETGKMLGGKNPFRTWPNSLQEYIHIYSWTGKKWHLHTSQLLWPEALSHSFFKNMFNLPGQLGGLDISRHCKFNLLLCIPEETAYLTPWESCTVLGSHKKKGLLNHNWVLST